MLSREELAALKPGDEVAWKRNVGWRIVTVKTIAATSIVTADGARWTKKFGKKFGKMFGCGSDSVYLQRITPEIREAIEKATLASRLDRIEWERHTVETLRRIAAIVEGRAPSDEVAA
jgi:hypothetical protein